MSPSRSTTARSWPARRETTGLSWPAPMRARMLPQIFRPGDPVLDVSLPPETRSAIGGPAQGIANGSVPGRRQPRAGSISSGRRSGRRRSMSRRRRSAPTNLPAVTQLFTEDYMVLFLLHNTLGAWWAGQGFGGAAGAWRDRHVRRRTARRVRCRQFDLDVSALCRENAMAHGARRRARSTAGRTMPARSRSSTHAWAAATSWYSRCRSWSRFDDRGKAVARRRGS